MAQVVVRLPDQLAKTVRVWCIEHDMRMSDLVREGLREQCRARGIPVDELDLGESPDPASI